MDGETTLRKIIHVDMDAFYAAIEMRDNPKLKNRPIAVGGSPRSRGVISTANYEARRFGVRSALPSAMAMRLCPGLTILPPDITRYKEESIKIHDIFLRFTDLVEPLSLDEAYLDVSGSPHFNGSATRMAEEIRRVIYLETHLTASAGIAPNKFLAKIASDWNKPDGQFLIAPAEVEGFVRYLPVRKIAGVGKVTAEKMRKMGINTCGDLQSFSPEELASRFGRFGRTLYKLSRGIDDREVVTSRERKSLSVERTFSADLRGFEECAGKIPDLYDEFTKRLSRNREKEEHEIKTIFVKVKFSDFSSTTVERSVDDLASEKFVELFREGYGRKGFDVRLIGLGVKFADNDSACRSGSVEQDTDQLALFGA
jgi:DNA polymerase-4